MLFFHNNHQVLKKTIMSSRSIFAQSMNELLIVLVASSISLFAIGSMIHGCINKDIDKIENKISGSTNAIKVPSSQSLPACTCNPPQGANGWRCGVAPCGATERLITTTCTPIGCGPAQGVKEQECIEDSQCCDQLKDTNFCGTGGHAPDCPIGERILQKTCGKDTATYACRTDEEGPDVDHNPSCKPKCIGKYSPNEAAAIVNPSLPIICPGDDTDLDSSHGPWVRDKSGVGIESKILGNGISACNHSDLPDQKCELYCLTGYQPNPDGLTCDPILCTQGPTALKTVIAKEEIPEGSTRSYTYTFPNSCPIFNGNSYILFNITLGEADIQLWNNATSTWDTLSTSGDNNNIFNSIKLYPLGTDSKYFADRQVKWKVTQADGDKDRFLTSIVAEECGHPSLPQNITIQNPNDQLTNESVVIRTFNIPRECNPIDESSYFSVNVQLINAALQVYDVNADTWIDAATSGKNNQQFLSLKYHPLGLENRFFNGAQIMWRISTALGSKTDYQTGITVTDCYVTMCAGAPKEGWVTALGPTTSCAPVCASVGWNPDISPEGMSCASGKNRPMSGTGTISYIHDCASGWGCNGNISGPTQTHLSDVNCYRNDQNEDGQLTDITVACYCRQ